jgi:hypothetical protein
MAQVGNSVASNYSQTEIALLEINEPQVHEKLFRPYMSEMKEYMYLREMGYESMVSANTWKVFEADKAHIAFKVAAHAVGGSAGLAVELTLHADSIDASGYFYPRQNMIVTFPGNPKTAIQATITAINSGGAGRITVTPIKSGDTIPAVSNGDTLILTGSAFGEGGGMPTSAFKKTTAYTFQSQIMKEAIGASGSALTDATYIKYFNQANEFQGYYNEALVDINYRLTNQINSVLTAGQKNTSATAALDPSTDGQYAGKLLTSTSLIEAAATRGIQGAATSGWSTPLAGLDALSASLIKQYVGTNVPIWGSLGLDLKVSIENDLQDLFNGTESSYIEKVVKSTGLSQLGGVNFTGFNKTYNYIFDVNFALSNPETFDATGYGYANYGVLIPLRTQEDVMDKNSRKVPNFGVRHKGMGSYNRKFIIDKLSGIGAASGNEKTVHTHDYTNYYQMAELGAEFMCANALVYMKKS